LAHAMVVDDSRTIRKLLSHTLKELGYEVSEAENGRAALDALNASAAPVNVILTDWNMPEMNGLEFLKQVRGDEKFQQIPVIMVTTETEMEHMVMAMEAGANEYVMKPFTADILTDKLRIAGLPV
jgi:two-component system chemotaxis response regulator CheY